MLYNKVPTDLKFVEREKEVSKFWKEHHIFEKSIEEREAALSTCFMTVRRQQTASRMLDTW